MSILDPITGTVGRRRTRQRAKDLFLPSRTLRCGKIVSEIQSFCKEELVEPFRQLQRLPENCFCYVYVLANEELYFRETYSEPMS